MGFRLGDNLSNFFGASDENDLVVGLGGDDTVEVGGGTDLVLAGAGSDTIIVGSGTNFLFGGRDEDADTFRFLADSSGLTTVLGFQDGIDKIDLSAFGVTGFNQLIVLPEERATLIVMGDLQIAVTGNVEPLDANDFIFAPRDTRTLDFDTNQAVIELDLSDFSNFPNFPDVRSAAPVIEITSLMGWDNFNFVEVNERGAPWFTASGDNAAFNKGGNDASFSALDPTFINDTIDDIIDLLPDDFPDGIDVNLDTDFDFVSFNAGGLTEALTLTVTAFDDDEEMGAQVFELAAGEMADEPFVLDPTIFSSVDEVVFTASGDSDTRFVIDDIVVADDLVDVYNAIPSLPDALVTLLV
ncbi:calcium-binding protein [Marinibacterium profundimaris]|uniref:hypothetical protein n=1 Tax=Marinibacterium profundimaris TaxID=1679460 RepID=UPI000B525274|nr:hypothetical protein [Marinibacterium profundimaris]